MLYRSIAQLKRRYPTLAIVGAAAWYGYYLGSRSPEDLARTLSIGLTVGAIAYAIGFALTGQVQRSLHPIDVLERDRRLIRYGYRTLKGAIVITLLSLAYIGVSGMLAPESRVTAFLSVLAASSLGWLLYRIPLMYRRQVRNIVGMDDQNPDLGGLWKRRERYRREAIEDLVKTDGGWLVNSSHPFSAEDNGPVFLAGEVAIRYGALQAEALLHYVQLCDRPEQVEAANRVDRIASCLSEMERLRELEVRMRATMSSDYESQRWLIQE